MKTELPRPADILEELAEKVVGHIDRLSTTSFDSALDEMVEYHRFLIEAYGTRTQEGVSFSYAEISDWIEPPHQGWLRQYRRLFDRAAMHIDQDPDLIGALARTPMRLLGGLAPISSPAITDSILDLGILLVGRLENWITQRIFIKDRSLPEGPSKIELRGSDKTAFKNVIIDVVGAWESLIQFAPSIYGFNDLKKSPVTQQWNGIVRSLSFFRRHLRNTAYFVASATWNEDDIGITYFQDALVRWTDAFDYALPDDFYGTSQLFLFPSLGETDWENAEAEIRRIDGSSQSVPIEPFPTFKVLLHGLHSDVVLVTAAVLLRWYIEGKQKSEISLRVVSRLLDRHIAEPDEHRGPVAPDFKSLFMQILRIEVAGQRFSRRTYGSTLDDIVALLDEMTERDVISGRVFTPSTIHGRDGLRLAFLALLLVKVGQDTGETLIKQIDTLATNEKAFPQGHRTLADLVGFLNGMSEALIRDQSRLAAAVRQLNPEIDFEHAVARLDQILRRASSAIQLQRAKRIRTSRVEPTAIERIRKRAEDIILTYPAGVLIFQDFDIVRDPIFQPQWSRETRVNKLPKGMFTSPQMQWNWSDLDETIVSAINQWTALLVWKGFWNRRRSISRTRHGFESPKFWRLVKHLARQIDASPSLLLSNSDQIRTVLDWAHQLKKAPGVQLRPRSKHPGARYLTSIEGIDVYGGNSEIGPILFSGKALKRIIYHPVDESDHAVSLHDVADEDPWQFSLVARISQQLSWNDELIFEIQFVE